MQTLSRSFHCVLRKTCCIHKVVKKVKKFFPEINTNKWVKFTMSECYKVKKFALNIFKLIVIPLLPSDDHKEVMIFTCNKCNKNSKK